jgi:hypothetical protein
VNWRQTAFAYATAAVTAAALFDAWGIWWIAGVTIVGAIVGALAPRLRPPMTVVVEGVVEEEDSDTVVVEQWVVSLRMPFWADEDAKTDRALEVQQAIPLHVPLTTRWRDG